MTQIDDKQISDLFGTPRRSARRCDPDGYKIVSVRLREAEFRLLCEQAHSLGLTNNMALRIAARRIGGFVEIDPATRTLLQQCLEQISRIARGIAGLQAQHRASGSTDMAALAELRVAFGQEFARLDAELSALLNVSRRRLDGRVILKEGLSK